MKVKFSLIATIIATLMAPTFAEHVPNNNSHGRHSRLGYAMPSGLGYGSPEHWYLGSYVSLIMPNGSGGIVTATGNNVTVKTEKVGFTTYNLSFADIIWLAGDIFGEPKQVISLSSNPSATFLLNAAAFDKYKKYLPKVLSIFKQELAENQSNIANGNRLVVPKHYNYDYNNATGGWGGLFGALFVQGLYVKLAAENYDHFGSNAFTAYSVGHTLALKAASTANNASDLAYAYFLDGFADHFLTDMFAAGHVRTPRQEIVKYCSNLPQGAASYLTKLEHDQDGTNGVWYLNNNGQVWLGFGDDSLFIPQNSDNKNFAIAALQTSVSQVYNAYITRNPDVSANLAVMQNMTPNISAIATYALNQTSLPPLYVATTYSNGMPLVSKYANGSYDKLNCLSSALAAAWDGAYN